MLSDEIRYSAEWLSAPALTPRNIRNFMRKVDRRGPDECWPWTGAKSGDGRGTFTVDGVMYASTHLALILDGRPRPAEPFHHALHGDCSEPLCHNPAHLRWGTNDENVADKLRLGRAAHQKPGWRPNTKITEDDVRYIRSSPLTGKALAQEFGISAAAVSLIRNRKVWADIG